ncbi:GAST product family protein [Salix suchowensis]|nr:GAST product family protein [Salix suchowensis]
MAMPTKFLTASLLLSLLVLHFSEADHDPVVNSNLAASSPPKKIDCGSACKARCQLSSRPRLCVPPGTAGNYEACPCYASLTTHGGRRKCP